MEDGNGTEMECGSSLVQGSQGVWGLGCWAWG